MRDPSLWPNVEEPATQHPFSPTLAQMVGIYKHLERTTDRRQPLIKLAAYVQKFPRIPNLWLFLVLTCPIRFRSLKEVGAAATLGCHSATVTPAIFTELCTTQYTGGSTKSQVSSHFANQPLPLSLTEIDFLAENGKRLTSALEADAVANGRLSDAIDRFLGAEESSKLLIESAIARTMK
jgi:transaldolase